MRQTPYTRTELTGLNTTPPARLRSADARHSGGATTLISDIVSKQWDVIVIGTGIGGGTIGRRLAESGLSVLFVERGPRGSRAEQHQINPNLWDPAARRIRGFWPTPIEAVIGDQPFRILGTVGAGVGGTSVFYAASLERPERHDLDHSESRPHPTGGWPVSFDDYTPYLEEAERLYHVCGEQDPLAEHPSALTNNAPPLSEGDAELVRNLRRRGLHPYRMHLGIRYLPDCMECTGHKCPRPCKMDGRSAGVEPALATGCAALLHDCEVVALRGGRRSVTHLDALHGGRLIQLRGRYYVLAGGALGSARLLLASASPEWPRGWANDSGLVGRNLMFHLNELLAIWPERPADFAGPAKTIALRDFYFRDQRRLGLLQSLGLSASYGNIVQFLNDRFDRSIFRNLRPVREFMRLPALAAERLFGNARVLAAILEDLPYESNRVELVDGDRDRIKVTYSLAEELLERRQYFRRAVKRSLGSLRSFFLNLDAWPNLAHPCGTARFGTDPARSVLDPHCRAHGIDNLYVVDSSFMPTSMGVNPSLMIAANALRVGDRIARLG